MIHVWPCRERLGVRARVGLGLGEAVHVQPGAERGDHDERHPHQARVGQVHLVHRQLHRRRRDTDDDHERHEQLRDRDAEVAPGGVQPERKPFLPSG